MAIHWIDFNYLEVYEAGAMLVTRLAFPGESEAEETCSRVHASLCAYALGARCEIEPDWATSPQTIKPIYALRRQCDIDRDLRTLERRLRDRMAAARMAIGFLKEALTGEVPKLPAGVERLSINQMAQLVLDDTGHSDPENVETRIWRPSLPVIHLCSAIQVMLQLGEPETGPLGLEALLLSREVIECVVRAAECHEAVIARSRRLRIAPQTLIKFRLTERR
jgi:hypothetical protein